MGPVLWNLADEILDELPWFSLRIRKVGITGSYNHERPFDLSNACPTCGAGAKPKPTLVADLTRMRNSAISCTAHEGLVVVRKDVAEALAKTDLTGFSIQPVLHVIGSAPDERYRWLRVESVWPRMHSRRVLAIEDPCPSCSRAGHFDAYKVATEFWYLSEPEKSCDFNLTWEYFGVWRHHGAKRAFHVGGKQQPIISQRARRTLLSLGLKQMAFDPVFFVDRPQWHDLKPSKTHSEI